MKRLEIERSAKNLELEVKLSSLDKANHQVAELETNTRKLLEWAMNAKERAFNVERCEANAITEYHESQDFILDMGDSMVLGIGHARNAAPKRYLGLDFSFLEEEIKKVVVHDTSDQNDQPLNVVLAPPSLTVQPDPIPAAVEDPPMQSLPTEPVAITLPKDNLN